jgi:hypothetical protein
MYQVILSLAIGSVWLYFFEGIFYFFEFVCSPHGARWCQAVQERGRPGQDRGILVQDQGILG